MGARILQRLPKRWHGSSIALSFGTSRWLAKLGEEAKLALSSLRQKEWRQQRRIKRKRRATVAPVLGAAPL